MEATQLVIMGRNSELIRSVEAWFAQAPPKRGAAHWVDGKSAKELAKAWFRTGVPAVPDELRAALGSGALAGAEVRVARPELVTMFDALPGGGRHHDLLLKLRRGDELIVAGVEAKASETLDSLVLEKYEKAVEARDSGTSTNLPERIEGLVSALFGRTLSEDVRLGALRYQLLTAAAGTLVEADRAEASAAVLLVHELQFPEAAVAVSQTQLAVADFIAALGGDHRADQLPGIVTGPYAVAGGGRIPSGMPLYVALIRPATSCG